MAVCVWSGLRRQAGRAGGLGAPAGLRRPLSGCWAAAQNGAPACSYAALWWPLWVPAPRPRGQPAFSRKPRREPCFGRGGRVDGSRDCDIRRRGGSPALSSAGWAGIHLAVPQGLCPAGWSLSCPNQVSTFQALRRREGCRWWLRWRKAPSISPGREGTSWAPGAGCERPGPGPAGGRGLDARVFLGAVSVLVAGPTLGQGARRAWPPLGGRWAWGWPQGLESLGVVSVLGPQEVPARSNWGRSGGGQWIRWGDVETPKALSQAALPPRLTHG